MLRRRISRVAGSSAADKDPQLGPRARTEPGGEGDRARNQGGWGGRLIGEKSGSLIFLYKQKGPNKDCFGPRNPCFSGRFRPRLTPVLVPIIRLRALSPRPGPKSDCPLARERVAEVRRVWPVPPGLLRVPTGRFRLEDQSSSSSSKASSMASSRSSSSRSVMSASSS